MVSFDSQRARLTLRPEREKHVVKEMTKARPSKNQVNREDAASAADEAVQRQHSVTAQDWRPVVDTEQRHERIARLAYQRAQARDFAAGGELEDWLLVERDIDEGMPRGS
jgi:hypothetical protein